MKGLYQLILIIVVILCLIGLILFFKHAETPVAPSSPMGTGLVAQSDVAQNYRGPIKPIPGNPELVRVQILVRDSPDPSGLQIESVTFNHEPVPLKPRDVIGNRGSTGFQVAPGKYTLRWTVNRNKRIWPRTITHEEIVEVSPRDLWIQVLIEGEKASIS